jgi:hypothetical protein
MSSTAFAATANFGKNLGSAPTQFFEAVIGALERY